ncbi:MAG: B12-binding domain/radical domain protein, family [Acidobacteria bacterium]|nr:B12-binding domain/radical domain protein, family [Acidobacteriota bacterium]
MKHWQQRERARELLSKEVGYVRKPHGGKLRVALAFPNTYFVGMSNLGFQTVYTLFNAEADIVCERVFLPPKTELAAQLASGAPLLTLESQTPVGDFDVLAFSVSFEWDYTNVLTLLRLAGLPSRAEARTDRHPLVLIGGAVTFVNPEPLALFADAIAAGEGEVLIPSLVRAFQGASDRTDLLRRLAAERGFYIPSFYDVRYTDAGTIAAFVPRPGTGAPPVVRKAALKTTDAVDPPATTIFTPDTEFGSRFLVEVVRGCANLCRFCWAGYNYLPVRAFPKERILELAARARPHANRVGLVSIALCDHPEIEEILTRLAGMGYSISPASLRLDDITPPLVRLLRESGERTITIAPETGSDRLRRVINKTITNDQILASAEMIFASGIENLKLYFMIGLPTETDEDLVAIRDLVLQLRGIMLAHARGRGRIGRLVGSVNPLVPKPGTAYQWLPMEDDSSIERKIQRVRGLMAGIDNVYFNIKSERHSFYQALLSLGDRRVAPAIEAAERNGGNWRAAVAESNVDAHFFVFRDRSRDAVLPWDIIDGGMKADFYRSEFDKALREEWTLPPKRQKENARLLPVLQ